MKNPFTKHCHSVGETYVKHLAFAVGCGTKMILGGLAGIVHGLIPFTFERTGGRTVSALYERRNSGARLPATQAHSSLLTGDHRRDS